MKFTNRQKWAGFTGATFGPLIVFPATCLLIIIKWVVTSGATDLADEFAELLFVGFCGCIVAYTMSFIYGLPIYFLLTYYKKLTLLNILIASVIPIFLFGTYANDEYTALFLGYYSLVVSLSCWYSSSRILRLPSSNNSFKADAQKARAL